MLSKRGVLGQRALWILTSYQHNQIEPLTIDPDVDGGFLPIFSFEEEATRSCSSWERRGRSEGGAVGRRRRES